MKKKQTQKIVNMQRRSIHHSIVRGGYVKGSLRPRSLLLQQDVAKIYATLRSEEKEPIRY